MAKNDPTVGEALIVRYELIECLIAQGMHKRHVVQYVRDHEAELQWDISDRQVRNYFDTVQERIKQGVMRIDRSYYHARSIKRLDYLYQSAVAAFETAPADSGNKPKHHANALNTEKELIDLLHLDDASAEQDWKQAAEQAGLDPQGILQGILTQHAIMSAAEIDEEE